MTITPITQEMIDEAQAWLARPPLPHPPTVYRRHNCQRKHRTLTSWAHCVWPNAAWILGGDQSEGQYPVEGPWATVAHCGVQTVMFHPTREDAEQALAFIDQTGCGHRCDHRPGHQLIHIQPK